MKLGEEYRTCDEHKGEIEYWEEMGDGPHDLYDHAKWWWNTGYIDEFNNYETNLEFGEWFDDNVDEVGVLDWK